MDDDEARETSGGVLLLVVAHARERGGDGVVEEALRRAGIDVDPADAERQVQGLWVSFATRNALYSAVADLLGSPAELTEAGARAVRYAGHLGLGLVMRGLGSPRVLYSQLPRFMSRFSTTATLTVEEVGRSRAVLTMRTADRYEPSPLDCLFVTGLLSSVPTLFGSPRATVRHVRCQWTGHAACRYEISWVPSLSWRHRLTGQQPGQEVELTALRAQVDQLHHVAADLVGSADVHEALDRIIDRATTALLAPAYLLVLAPREGVDAVLRYRGVDPEQARSIADALLEGSFHDAGATVVEVVSPRSHHGHLVVLHGSDHAPFPEEREVLGSYARHAAAALDLFTALADSRRERDRAEALLGLAQDLVATDDEQACADAVVRALQEVTGCRGSSVFLWNPGAGELELAVAAGHTPQEEATLRSAPLRADEVPELATLLARREPMLLDADRVSPRLAHILTAVGVKSVVVAPLTAGDTLLGVATASWGSGTPAAALDAETRARVVAVSSQGATALQRVRLTATVQHQAHHDGLSGLPNRALFTQVLADALRATHPEEGTAVLCCDLDRFKSVNDELGHRAGDELLRQTAARLRGLVRPGDTLARLSGDEFAVVVPRVDEQAAVAVAQRVVDAVAQPYRIDGRELRVTASVGVAVHEGTDGRADRLLGAATDATRTAKSRGRGQVAVAGSIESRLVVPSLEAELARAIDARQMRLYFQPLVDLAADGGAAVVGAEALIRWAHPRLGLLAPGAFLPLAEEAGLVTELDLWALEEACRTAAGWRSPTGHRLSVAVNLASSTLVDPRLAGAARSALRAYDLAPERLHLEVVESRSLVDLPGVIDHLAELRQMGMRIALDDFGTGYSTLTWLQSLPVDQVKIDRSFVRRLPDDAPSSAVVRGVVALAREIGLAVVAEGVEDAGQLAALQDAGCRWVQGYLLGRPAPLLDAARPSLTGSS